MDSDDIYDDNVVTTPEVVLQMARWCVGAEMGGPPDTPDSVRRLVRFTIGTIEGMDHDAVVSAVGLAETACLDNVREAAGAWTAFVDYSGPIDAVDAEDLTEIAHKASEAAVLWARVWSMLSVASDPIQLQPFPDA